MPLNVPDVGENLILGMIVNRTAPENLVLRLYQNDITPSDTDTAATYTVSSFPGYANITLPGASWNAPSAGSITYSAQQAFTCTGATSQPVYGYYLTQLTSGILVWSERAAAAPFTITNVGDSVRLTPAITAS
jgi:hypothetical protein